MNQYVCKNLHSSTKQKVQYKNNFTRERDLDDSMEFNVVVVVSAREFNEVPASSRCVLVV